MDLSVNLAEAFFGALFGTSVAFLIERFLRKADARNREVASLNNLITDLHLRRALAIISPAESSPGPNNDRIYATAAVMQIRDSIRETRLALRPKSETFDVLVAMSSACNGYLERVEYYPERYQYELHTLRLIFSEIVDTLGLQKGVVNREPGAGAFGLSEST